MTNKTKVSYRTTEQMIEHILENSETEEIHLGLWYDAPLRKMTYYARACFGEIPQELASSYLNNSFDEALLDIVRMLDI